MAGGGSKEEVEKWEVSICSETAKKGGTRLLSILPRLLMSKVCYLCSACVWRKDIPECCIDLDLDEYRYSQGSQRNSQWKDSQTHLRHRTCSVITTSTRIPWDWRSTPGIPSSRRYLAVMMYSHTKVWLFTQGELFKLDRGNGETDARRRC